MKEASGPSLGSGPVMEEKCQMKSGTGLPDPGNIIKEIIMIKTYVRQIYITNIRRIKSLYRKVVQIIFQHIST